MKPSVARYAGPLIGLILFAGALWVLHQALADYRYQDVAADLERLPPPNCSRRCWPRRSAIWSPPATTGWRCATSAGHCLDPESALPPC